MHINCTIVKGTFLCQKKYKLYIIMLQMFSFTLSLRAPSVCSLICLSATVYLSRQGYTVFIVYCSFSPPAFPLSLPTYPQCSPTASLSPESLALMPVQSLHPSWVNASSVKRKCLILGCPEFIAPAMWRSHIAPCSWFLFCMERFLAHG